MIGYVIFLMTVEIALMKLWHFVKADMRRRHISETLLKRRLTNFLPMIQTIKIPAGFWALEIWRSGDIGLKEKHQLLTIHC